LTRRHISAKYDGMVTDRTYTRLLKAPEQSFFLFGMRGVGKSTWARHAFPDAHHFDLLDEGLFQDYLRDARLFGRERPFRDDDGMEALPIPEFLRELQANAV
jgi:hypothetical protein